MTEGEKAEDAPTSKASNRGVGHSGSILGNHVETDKMLLEGTRSVPGFRGDVIFSPTPPDRMPNPSSAERRSARPRP